MKNLKEMMTVALLAGTLVSGAIAKGAIAAAPKFGYIDLQKAIQSTSAGKKAKTELETEFNRRKKDMDTKQADIKKMTEDFEKKKAVLSEEAAQKKDAEIKEEVMKFQDLLRNNQIEIQKKQGDLTEPILKKMRGIIDAIAKKEEYAMIFEKNEQSVLWARADLDLTDKIVQDFEKQK